jgi:protein translocase SecG subunit
MFFIKIMPEFIENFTQTIQPYLLPTQIILLVIATVLILLQNRGVGLSSSFGGSNEVYLTRRGIERWVVNFTVICIAGFVILRILELYI